MSSSHSAPVAPMLPIAACGARSAADRNPLTVPTRLSRRGTCPEENPIDVGRPPATSVFLRDAGDRHVDVRGWTAGRGSSLRFPPIEIDSSRLRGARRRLKRCSCVPRRGKRHRLYVRRTDTDGPAARHARVPIDQRVAIHMTTTSAGCTPVLKTEISFRVDRATQRGAHTLCSRTSCGS